MSALKVFCNSSQRGIYLELYESDKSFNSSPFSSWDRKIGKSISKNSLAISEEDRRMKWEWNSSKVLCERRPTQSLTFSDPLTCQLATWGHILAVFQKFSRFVFRNRLSDELPACSVLKTSYSTK